MTKTLTPRVSTGETHYWLRPLYLFFLQLKVGDNLFENTVSAMAFAANQSYSVLDKPVDRDKWDYVTS